MFVNVTLLLSSLGLVAVHSIVLTPAFLTIYSPESINKPAWNQYLYTEEPEPIVSLDENDEDNRIVEGQVEDIE